MKIEKAGVSNFKPVEIKLTFESEAELGEFYSIFNFTPITEQLHHLSAYDIRDVLNVSLDVYGDSHSRLNRTLERRQD